MSNMPELREQILQNSKRIRRKAILEQMEILTGLYAKADSNKGFHTLTEIDWNRMIMINDIMRLNDERILSGLKGVIHASVRNS